MLACVDAVYLREKMNELIIVRENIIIIIIIACITCTARDIELRRPLSRLTKIINYSIIE